MNCPFCGAEMERGKVVTEKGIGLFCLPPEGELPFLCLTRKNIEKQGGIVLDGPYHWNLPGNETAIPAHVCRDCRKIVMDY